jgi:hypothetical protein
MREIVLTERSQCSKTVKTKSEYNAPKKDNMQVSTHPITRRFAVDPNVPNRSYDNLH